MTDTKSNVGSPRDIYRIFESQLSNSKRLDSSLESEFSADLLPPDILTYDSYRFAELRESTVDGWSHYEEGTCLQMKILGDFCLPAITRRKKIGKSILANGLPYEIEVWKTRTSPLFSTNDDYIYDVRLVLDGETLASLRNEDFSDGIVKKDFAEIKGLKILQSALQTMAGIHLQIEVPMKKDLLGWGLIHWTSSTDVSELPD